MNETPSIRVHYWASARAAAGVPGDDLPVSGALSLAEVRQRAADLHPDTGLGAVADERRADPEHRPVGMADPDGVVVEPGSTVEFLPPFAGG